MERVKSEKVGKTVYITYKCPKGHLAVEAKPGAPQFPYTYPFFGV